MPARASPSSLREWAQCSEKWVQCSGNGLNAQGMGSSARWRCGLSLGKPPGLCNLSTFPRSHLSQGPFARAGRRGSLTPLNTSPDPGTGGKGRHSLVLPALCLLFFPFTVLPLKGGSPHLSPALSSLPSVVPPALQEGMAISVSSQGIFPPTLSGPGGNCQL